MKNFRWDIIFIVSCCCIVLHAQTSWAGETKHGVRPTPIKEKLKLSVPTKPIQLPDLVGTASSYGGGKIIYPIIVKVENQGGGPASTSKLKITCTEYKGSTPGDSCLSDIIVDVPELQAGHSNYPTLPYSPPLHCDPEKTGVTECRITVRVDSQNQVTEKNETNNVKVYSIAP